MISVKQKYITIIPCILVLLIITALGVINLKSYYEEILNSTGLVHKDFFQKLKEENERAIESDVAYQRMIDYLLQDSNGDREQSEDITYPLTTAEENGNAVENDKQQSLSLRANAALLLDAENNRVLYEKNGYKKLAMASTTKIMTCIVALENADPMSVVTISSYAASMPDVQLNARKGEQFYLGDLLYSLMLESHNDVAVAIAEHVGGTVQGFAAMMNKKAKELGCADTNFVTPNGLDADGHYTTARDLAVIASYAIKNQKFIEITNAANHSFKEIKSGRGFTVSNKNRFLYMMDGAIGVKTGFTGDAGYCFVGAIKRTDRTLVSVVLGCGWPPNKSLKWSDTKELMSYGVENYEERQIFRDVDLEPVFVEDGQEKYEYLNMEGSLTLLMREDEKVKIVYQVPRSLKAPVKQGDLVGSAKYYIDEVLYAEVPIYTTTGIAKIDYPYCLKEILKMWGAKY